MPHCPFYKSVPKTSFISMWLPPFVLIWTRSTFTISSWWISLRLCRTTWAYLLLITFPFRPLWWPYKEIQQRSYMYPYFDSSFVWLFWDCSEVTANLVELKLGVERKYLRPLLMNTQTPVENAEVTLLGPSLLFIKCSFPCEITVRLTFLYPFVVCLFVCLSCRRQPLSWFCFVSFQSRSWTPLTHRHVP